MKIIGLSGRAGAGKDYIYDHYFRNAGWYRFALADSFKIDIVGKGLASYDEVFKIKSPTTRDLLQKTGTENGRMIFGENIWCDMTLAWITHLSNTCDLTRWVITDVRFPNELDFIKKHGGKVIRINAPNRIANSSLSTEARAHISETALDNTPWSAFDFILNNDIENEATTSDQIHTFMHMHYPLELQRQLGVSNGN